MKTLKTLIIILVIAAAFIAVKLIFFPAQQAGGAPGGKGKGPQPATPVTVYIAQPQRLDNRIFVSGTVLPNEEVLLVPETSGKITGIYFKEGSRVSKGQLLVKINDAELQAQLRKLQVQEKLLDTQLERLQKLLDLKGISQEEYETLLTDVNAIKADIDLINAQLEKTRITAPFSGEIGLKSVSDGSYISPTTQIAILQQSDPVKIDFYIPEKYSALVSKGDTFSFSLENATGKYMASVIAIEPDIDQNTRTLHVRATSPNKKGEIRTGSYARVNFTLDRNESAILIPTESVIPVLKGKKVFVVRNGKAEEVMVETGLRSDKQIEIISGLQQGDTVVTTGSMQIKAGAPVKIVKR